MDTKHLADKTLGTVESWYRQAIITQSQYEAFDYLFGLLSPASPRVGAYETLPQDTKDDIRRIIQALPDNIAREARIRIISRSW